MTTLIYEGSRRILNLEDDLLTELSEDLLEFSLNIDENLARTTPVDEGTARANWTFDEGDGSNLNEVYDETSRPISRSPQATLSAPRIKMAWKISAVNNVPYIVELNNGSSQQAPSKFIEIAIDQALIETFGGI